MLRLSPVLIGYAALAATLLDAAGPATFRSRRDYATFDNFRVAAGDLNGDGIQDLLTGAGGTGALVEFGNGDGTFRDGPSYSSTFTLNSPILVDINGDGKLDLITAFHYLTGLAASGLAVSFGNGDGTFQPAFTYDAGSDIEAWVLTQGDFNRDQITDFALLGGDGIWVFLGQGKGAFASGVLIPITSPEFAGFSLVSADFDGDGNIDLVAGTGSGFVLLLGHGDGTFESPVASTLHYSVDSIVVADLNSDGKLDLAITSVASPSSAQILFGNGNGTFQPYKAISLPNDHLLAVGDVNGDGKLDLVSNTGYIVFGQAAGKFGAPVYYPDGYSAFDGQPTQIVLADLRNSGHPDIVAMNFYGAFSVLLNKGNGAFTEATAVATGGGPSCPIFADFNRDGKPDMAVAASGVVLIYLGTGSSLTFFKAPTSIAIAGAYCLAGGDYNRDGKLDLAVLGAGASVATVTTLLGNGDGTFTQGAVLNSTAVLGGPIVADFNRDGKLDLAFSGNFITFGNGDGTFGALTPLSTSLPVLNAFSTVGALGDFNGDKAPDLAIPDAFNNTMYILLNNGRGTFRLSSFSTQPQAGGAGYCVPGDINNDGRPGLICNTNLGDIALYLSNGDGSFTLGSVIQVPLFLAESIIYTDLNGDGIPDIGQVNQQSFGVFQGNGDGTFQDPQWFGLGTNPVVAVPANLHGQSKTSGKPDVVVTDYSGYVTLLLNTTP